MPPPMQYGLNKSFPLKLLVTSIFLTLGQTAVAYDFTRPETPSPPTNLPSETLTIDKSTSSNPGTTNPASNWGWYGPLTNTATNNDVHVTKQANSSFVFGGWSETDSETVFFNRVVIEKGGSMKNIYGGYSRNGDAKENVVEIYGSTSSNDLPAVYGGESMNCDAIGNMVFVRDGAKVYSTITGGMTSNGNDSKGKAVGNVVVIEKGAQVNSSGITGGSGDSAFNNSVFIFGTISGGNWIVGGKADNGGESSSNLVYVGPGVEIQQSIFAARASLGTASNNVLIIEDAQVGGNVGAVDAAVPTSPDWSTAAYTQGTSNELHLLGNTVIEGGAGANFDGVQLNGARGFDSLVHISGTVTVGSLEGFDNLIFELTDDNVQTAALTITNEHEVIYQGEPILDLTSVSTTIEGDALTDPTSGAKLITSQNESLKLMVDDKTSFTDETNVFVDQSWTVSNTVIANGGIQIDEIFVDSEGNIVTSLDGVATILGKKEEKIVKPTVESRTLSESFLGTIAFVNQGAEFIADEGIQAMAAAASSDGVSAFGAVHGGTSKYETGSHVDVDGVSLATGATIKVGNLMLAGFIEAGWASSESHVPRADGDGDHDYYGVGLASRYSFNSTFYVDGSLRFGKTSTEFNGTYAKDAATYDADGLYGSMHIGAGYVFNLMDQLDLDVYGRYVFTYLEGDKVNLGGNNGSLDMENTKTHAFRVGAKLNGDINENAAWRFGLAYEHVADGDAKSDLLASGLRVPLDVPTLKGDTGVVEAGFTMKPNTSSPWSADFGVKGYVGDREGVTGNMFIRCAF